VLAHYTGIAEQADRLPHPEDWKHLQIGCFQMKEGIENTLFLEFRTGQQHTRTAPEGAKLRAT
jgi:hypothetical protein